VSTFLLHAPPHWHEALEALVGTVQRVSVETWSIEKSPACGVSSFVRQLSEADSLAFHRAVPWWGLSGWGSFATLLEHGAAFGVMERRGKEPGLMSIAWIFDQAGPYDAIGVSTDPKYQRLGLGKATASALIDHILNVRGKVPLWSAPASNEASIGLARALGLSPVARETLLSWPVPSEPGTDQET
jgi:hypothetical protein